MANTYTQIFYHLVFVVKNRESLIHAPIKEKIYKYISGIISNQNQKLFIINGMPDHVHLLINCKPNINLSNLVKEIKEHSAKYINREKMIRGKFYWQIGFAAFSVSKKELPIILNYIKNQEAHHKIISFKSEYYRFLKEQEIDFQDDYLFDFII